MQKRILTLLLAVVMVLVTVAAPVKPVEAATGNNASKVIDALGVMKTDKGVSTSQTQKINRAQYAQMLVNMSGNKGKVTSKSNVSLFQDVPKTYWAAGYIQTAINQGWMSGYMNGSFKPAQSVTLMEAVNGVLKLLGYTNSDFTGSISAAQMALYDSKELDKNITKTKNQAMTRKDLMNLFYNTLTATTKDGKVYAETLGYKIDAKGEVDYLSLVNNNMEGPILADGDWKDEIPFLLGTATFYKDGTLGTISDIQENDVIYYSKDLKSIWAYDNKVTGTIQSILPDRLVPTSVMVGQKEYKLGTNDMSVAFSSLGKVDVGDTVTLILGKDDSVVDVLTINEYNTNITGIVIGTGEHVVNNTKDDMVAANYVTFVDAGGNEYVQDYDIAATIYNIGDVIRVTYENGVGTIKLLNQGSSAFANCTFSEDGTKLGNNNLAANVKVIDYFSGNYVKVNPKRLSGTTLSGSSVYYYETNSSGNISKLILNNVSGDVFKYGIITNSTSQMGTDSMSYEYTLDGTVKSAVANFYIAEKGPKGFIFDPSNSTQIKDTMDLTGITVKSIGTTTVQDSIQKYPMADNVAVFYYNVGKYSATTLSKVSDLKKYKLTAYYDRTIGLGGRVRVIVAENIN